MEERQRRDHCHSLKRPLVLEVGECGKVRRGREGGGERSLSVRDKDRILLPGDFLAAQDRWVAAAHHPLVMPASKWWEELLARKKNWKWAGGAILATPPPAGPASKSNPEKCERAPLQQMARLQDFFFCFALGFFMGCAAGHQPFHRSVHDFAPRPRFQRKVRYLQAARTYAVGKPAAHGKSWLCHSQ